MGEPARGYVWPPFVVGNDAAERHGAKSDRKLQPIVDDLLAWATGNLPWASGPSFAPSVDAWAWAEARCVLYRRWFNEKGHHDADEQPLAGLERWDRVETRAEKLREQLGIGPLALGKLLGTIGSIDGPAAQSGLDALKAAGAALVQAAEQRALAPGAPDLDADGHERLHDGDDEEGDVHLSQ
ncbi:MAG: hypothetical protein QOD92_1049 [Acidimicrobiaceae bacterium]